MQLNTGSLFTSFDLTPDETQQALNVSPLFLAYLQNKIQSYATAVVASSLPYDANPGNQVKAILEYERLKNFVSAYEELFAELSDSINPSN
jgi:hypothetical protein